MRRVIRWSNWRGPFKEWALSLRHEIVLMHPWWIDKSGRRIELGNYVGPDRRRLALRLSAGRRRAEVTLALN